jgi:subtilisin
MRMIHGSRTRLLLISMAVVVVAVVALSAEPAQQPPAAAAPQPAVAVPAVVAEAAQREGRARVIVRLDVPAQPEGGLPPGLAQVQRQTIGTTQQQVMQRLAGTGARLVRQFETIPYMALEVGPDALLTLAQTPGVLAIQEDRLHAPDLAESVPLVEGDAAWAAHYDAMNWAVAILDTGVEGSHSFLAGKVVSEACYAGNGTCPNGEFVQIGAGAAVPCTFAPVGCRHGTHVAGIAAGSGPDFSGVAKRASIVAIQVFTRFTGASCTRGEDPCALAYESDIAAGLERVYQLRTTFQIASANLSLGGGLYSSQASCDADYSLTKMIVDLLRSVTIATVIASGNNGSGTGMTGPGCVSTAVSVGSTTESDTISPFSNSTSFLSLLAPGSEITSSVPGNGFETFNGTSMATPHVAGAWTILKQRSPAASVTTILTALQTAGLPITDPRNGVTKSRIRILNAINSFGPLELSVNDPRISEGQSGTKTLNFTVSLSGTRSAPVTATYATGDLTASGSGGDFAPGAGTVTIPAGASSQTVGVTINGDTAMESSETFALMLSNASGANVADDGIATIVNDDFTDPSLVGVLMKTAHITELRAAINEARAVKGLPAFSFTGTLIPQTTVVRALHFQEMYNAIFEAYFAAGLTPPSVDWPIPGVYIRAEHITVLRAIVVNLP